MENKINTEKKLNEVKDQEVKIELDKDEEALLEEFGVLMAAEYNFAMSM